MDRRRSFASTPLSLALAASLLLAAGCAPRAASPGPTGLVAAPPEAARDVRIAPRVEIGALRGVAIDPSVALPPPRDVVVAPTVRAAGPPRRPEGSPDVVVLAFGGHCGAFCGADDTVAYLGRASDETEGIDVLGAVVAAFEQRGLTVETRSYASHATTHRSPRSGRLEPGWLDAQAYLDTVKRDLIDGVADPTRVVLLAHSHGTVWANLLALNNLEVTFDYLISLDAVCWRWWAVHRRPLRRAFDGQPLPFPLADGDPCGLYAVPGIRGRRDVNDVVPANVIVGLEVRTALRVLSLQPNLVRDDDPDVRINGTTLNLWGIEADEDHARVSRYAPAMLWVAQAIDAFGLPDHGAFPMSVFVAPPPPVGFVPRDP